MEKYNKRIQNRSWIKASIIYGTFEPFNPNNAWMLNYSQAGMYIESSQSLKPDAIIYIYILNYSPKMHAELMPKYYLARVRWCHKIENDRWGIGVQHLLTSHTDIIAEKAACNSNQVVCVAMKAE